MATITLPGTTQKKNTSIVISGSPSIPGASVNRVAQTSNIGSLLQGGLNKATISVPAAQPAPVVPPSAVSRYGAIPVATGVSTAGTGAMASALSTAQSSAIAQAQAQQEAINQAAQQTLALSQQKRAANLATLDQRMQALQGSYESSLAAANQGYGTSLNLAQDQARLLQQQIDQNAAQTQQQLGTAKTTVKEEAAKASTNVEDTLRRTFDARGALDSTFYARELAKQLSGVESTKVQQIAQIEQQISQASQQAATQKQDVELRLNQAKAELEAKKNDYLTRLSDAYQQGRISIEELRQQADLDLANFASDAEIQRINQLNQVKFNLDSYLNDLNAKRANLVSSVSSANVDPFAAAQQRLQEVQSTAAYILQNPKNRDLILASLNANQGAAQAQSLLDAADEYIKQLNDTQRQALAMGQ